jgi:Protein of unknown function (DUF2380)
MVGAGSSSQFIGGLIVAVSYVIIGLLSAVGTILVFRRVFQRRWEQIFWATTFVTPARPRGTTNDHGTRTRALTQPIMIMRLCFVLWALLFVSCGPTVAQSVAVFDFELIDTSLEGAIRGARPDEQQRLARLSDQLRQLLRDSGRFSLVDITPIAREAQASNLQACGGCDIQLARRIGAKLAITGTVQKVSNLILNMNIYVRDASSGVTIAAMSADIRGNTDETWSRTLDWLVHNRLLAPGYGLQH